VTIASLFSEATSCLVGLSGESLWPSSEWMGCDAFVGVPAMVVPLPIEFEADADAHKPPYPPREASLGVTAAPKGIPTRWPAPPRREDLIVVVGGSRSFRARLY
jgi:hypothetical protein